MTPENVTSVGGGTQLVLSALVSKALQIVAIGGVVDRSRVILRIVVVVGLLAAPTSNVAMVFVYATPDLQTATPIFLVVRRTPFQIPQIVVVAGEIALLGKHAAVVVAPFVLFRCPLRVQATRRCVHSPVVPTGTFAILAPNVRYRIGLVVPPTILCPVRHPMHPAIR